VFYNGKQVEYDFGERGKKEWRGVGDYARILIPEIVNNTNKIIIIDSADIIAKKDLSELYFFDMGDNYFVFTLDAMAGKFRKNVIFSRNNFYPNTGVCLVNVRKFREDNLYYNAFFTAIAYKDLPCPYQDIFLVISNFKFEFWPLNYNCPQFFENYEQLRERKNDTVCLIVVSDHYSSDDRGFLHQDRAAGACLCP
jgi:lipopolysaccharide biosynthesis glycosyltransferase